MAHSFISWLEWFVASLETGVWRIDLESGNFQPVNADHEVRGGPLHGSEVVRGDARTPP